ncbi:MAG: polysulfide reductase NrfD [Candidatus Aminicenantes bacterium]|nr:MAG: polysulfide reductase NrfD [Candidatus Aminicenantes bacterium]
MKHKESGRNTRIIEDIIRPTATTGKWFYLTAAVLGALVMVGFAAWVYQLNYGLYATGMKNSVNWGVYMTNFVFFIGISHAGTLISAILRVFNVEWRRPITRAAEAITVFALIVGGLQIVFDLGRPGRLFNIITKGRLSSPLLWDVTCISVYFFSCVFYLLLALIPDMALLKNRENLKEWRKKLYRFLSFNWKDTPGQKRRLNKAIGGMAILLIPIFVSVHTVVSWIFGMTVRPMWHSSIFGPYFVTGAIFSGVASVILAVALIRKALHLENYLKPIHFNKLSLLLMAMAALWFYFTFSEYLTTGYGALTEELAVFNSKLAGEFSIIFWTMVACMALAFGILLARKKWIIGAATTASILVIIGMWLERFTIIVPTLTKSLEQGYKAGLYNPSTTEWLITIGSTAGFILFLVIFAKLFPIISIWEMKEAKQAILKRTRRMEAYLPGHSQPAEQ